MATHNTIADALETVVNAISGTPVKFYPEPEEKPLGTVSAELFFQDSRPIGQGATALWKVTAIVELSTRSNSPGWGAAVRRIRTLADASGSGSILAAIRSDHTLGGVVVGCLPVGGSSTGTETRKTFADGDRFCKELRLEVTYNT